MKDRKIFHLGLFFSVRAVKGKYLCSWDFRKSCSPPPHVRSVRLRRSPSFVFSFFPISFDLPWGAQRSKILCQWFPLFFSFLLPRHSDFHHPPTSWFDFFALCFSPALLHQTLLCNKDFPFHSLPLSLLQDEFVDPIFFKPWYPCPGRAGSSSSFCLFYFPFFSPFHPT